MTLARALAQLASCREAEDDVVAVMDVFGRHPGDTVQVLDVVRQTGLAEDRAEAILRALVAALVLDFDGAGGYRYERDVAVEMELRALKDRLRAHREHLQGNVARFRAHRDLY
ncbi:MAG: hypothetical protein QMD96_01665 [Anaerosomatales bacterium]|nr:hypothetical protein [Anaerosomatales bacterium]